MASPHLENAVSGTRDTIDPKFLEAMERLDNVKPNIPEGAFTVEEAAANWGIERAWAYVKLMELVKSGEVDRVRSTETGRRHYYFFTD